MTVTVRNKELCSVVLVGRPNVGKSTLFNRVCGSRRAIVAPVAGTTRDVIRESAEWLGTRFELVDTGGMFGASTDPLQVAVSDQGLTAIDDASLIVVLVDARDGAVTADREVIDRVRRVGVPMVLAVNKVDDPKTTERVGEFHELGIESVVAIAAEHGLGVGDLLDAVIAQLPGVQPGDGSDDREERRHEIGVAIIGRPNVGKSSLVNLFARADRVLVSDLAGTTRDAIDTVIKWHGRHLRLVDTAGIRRPGKVARSGHVESVSVTVARRAIKRADVALLVVDASAPLAKQDAVIAGEAERAGCGLIVVANKWDLVKGKEGFSKKFDDQLREDLKFADYAPIVHVSALTGARAPKVLELIEQVALARTTHIATSELNRFLAKVTKRHPPRSPGKYEVKILYGTQVATKPPRFLLFTNIATKFHFSYDRFLMNRFREAFDFTGSPIRLKVRARREPK